MRPREIAARWTTIVALAAAAALGCGGASTGGDAHAPGPVRPRLRRHAHAAYIDATRSALNAHDSKKLAALYGAGAKVVTWGFPAAGPAANAQRLFDAFPDMTVAVSRAWSNDNVLIAAWVMNGTQTGQFLGFPATKKAIGYESLVITTFNEDGFVVSQHDYWDPITVLQQTGAMAGPGRPIPALPRATEWHFARGDAAETENLAVVARGYEAFARRHTDEYLDLFTDDAVYDDVTTPEASRGKESLRTSFETTMKMFPDVKIQTGNAWSIAEFAVVEEEITGSQNAAVGPLPASTKGFDVHEVKVFELRRGKIARRTVYGNTVELLRELGDARF